MQNGDEASPSISPACRGQLVKMLVTFEPHCIFDKILHTYTFHYANTPILYTAIFHGCKKVNFQMEKYHIFLFLCSKTLIVGTR